MEGELRFPRIVAVTLSGKHLVFPDSIGESGALVLLAFRRHAQPPVDSWMNPISRRLQDAGKANFYEVPVLSGGWRMVSGFIDSGMRSGIPPHRHDHVATYYGNTQRVQDALSIDDLDTAYAYVIDEDGKVHFHDSGWASPEKISRAFEALTAIVPTS
ncbi:MAG: hypothetical protein ACLFP4_03470 [Spirochaetales bacterium]